ncbi:helix-turn-helix domain-containing protein [Niallia circulans]|uniref:Helix-turn-helix domain-containing protein n=1 Tax=Niallia circulans TaxID=1397 RepID=A0A941GJ58_NIACI|nr:helix-turn-helix domain-containing protein [Niallia circulans]MCB5238900.1 helix-turn-helix domain-containing protein [Niallia circulans]
MANKVALNASEAAEFMGISTRTLYRLVSKGEIPHTRAGIKLLFHREVIESWLKGENQFNKVRT